MSSGYLACAFDLLNVRNLDLIAQARARCDWLIVGVFDDSFALRITGRPPIVPLVERLGLVSHIRGVDEAVVHAPARWHQLNDHDVVFTVMDEGFAVDDVPCAVVLVPTRETTSWMLQDALRMPAEVSVA